MNHTYSHEFTSHEFPDLMAKVEQFGTACPFIVTCWDLDADAIVHRIAYEACAKAEALALSFVTGRAVAVEV